jgi:spermidine/putrescine transport system substrate-binding protein
MICVLERVPDDPGHPLQELVMRRPPAPEAAAVLAAQRPFGRFTRRTLLGAGATAFGLTACGTPAARQTEATCVSDDLSATEKTLVFDNWPQYVDVEGKKRPTLDAFQERTGIAVRYSEGINDNDEYFGRIQGQLSTCRPTGRDIIVLSDWLVGRLVRLGWVQKLDATKLPNVQANLLPSLRGRAIDPTGEHAVPWQGGLAGLAYNGRVTKEIRTVDELLTRPDLKGRVTLLGEMRDTMGLLLQSNGHDPGTFTDAQFDDALAKLRRAVESGQIRRFTGNDYTPELARGDIAACIGWSGDIMQLGAEDSKIRFVAPDSGVMIFSDDLFVPNRSAHRANAEQLANYYYDPAVAAQVAAFVNYICPVAGAQAEMDRIDPELARNPLIFPTAELLSSAKAFKPLDEAAARVHDQKFQAVIGA